MLITSSSKLKRNSISFSLAFYSLHLLVPKYEGCCRSRKTVYVAVLGYASSPDNLRNLTEGSCPSHCQGPRMKSGFCIPEKNKRFPALRFPIPLSFYACPAKDVTTPQLTLYNSGTVFSWRKLCSKVWMFRRNWLASLNKQFNHRRTSLSFMTELRWCLSKLSTRKGHHCTHVALKSSADGGEQTEMKKKKKASTVLFQALVQTRYPNLLSSEGTKQEWL